MKEILVKLMVNVVVVVVVKMVMVMVMWMAKETSRTEALHSPGVPQAAFNASL